MLGVHGLPQLLDHNVRERWIVTEYSLSEHSSPSLKIQRKGHSRTQSISFPSEDCCHFA